MLISELAKYDHLTAKDAGTRGCSTYEFLIPEDPPAGWYQQCASIVEDWAIEQGYDLVGYGLPSRNGRVLLTFWVKRLVGRDRLRWFASKVVAGIKAAPVDIFSTLIAVAIFCAIVAVPMIILALVIHAIFALIHMT